MKNTAKVRALLLGDLIPRNVTEDGRRAMTFIFDRMVEDEDLKVVPRVVRFLAVSELCDQETENDFHFTRLGTDSISNILEALMWGFPEQANNLSAVARSQFMQMPANYEDKHGHHAAVLSQLFAIADYREFNIIGSNYESHLFGLLDASFLKRLFRKSIIYAGQSGDLSNRIGKFVTVASIGRKETLTSVRWDSLLKVVSTAKKSFASNSDPIFDTSLEYALLNDLCFKLFGTLSPLNKLGLIDGQFNPA